MTPVPVAEQGKNEMTQVQVLWMKKQSASKPQQTTADIITVNKENEAESPAPSYKTKLCTAVHRLLGSARIAGPIQQQLLELDTLCHFIQTNKRPPQRSIANYERLLAAVKTCNCKMYCSEKNSKGL